MLIVLRPHRGGGIGNYLFHLGHAVLRAEATRSTLLIPGSPTFPTLNQQTVALDFSIGESSYDPEEIEILGLFLHGDEATRAVGFDGLRRALIDNVGPLFRDDPDRTEVGEETLVIHVRSGDIFQPERISSSYAQPPLSWYELLIEGRGYDDVAVVTESNPASGSENPVLGEIRRRWPHVRRISGHKEHDFHTLRQARHLALSQSTFAITAAMLNVDLVRLHVARYPHAADPNMTDAFPPDVDRGFEQVDDVINGYEAVSDWRFLPEQVRLMLDLPVEAIDPGDRSRR